MCIYVHICVKIFRARTRRTWSSIGLGRGWSFSRSGKEPLGGAVMLRIFKNQLSLSVGFQGLLEGPCPRKLSANFEGRAISNGIALLTKSHVIQFHCLGRRIYKSICL